MDKEQKNRLLQKYYKAETSLEEETGLKENFLPADGNSPENDAFGYYITESKIPEGLEDDLFNSIITKKGRNKSMARHIYSIISAAAVVVLVVGIYLDIREKKEKEMETRFVVMEQAIARVSETLQPQDPQDMLVLWVDDNVEIIIN
jgi:hypothetical protein